MSVGAIESAVPLSIWPDMPSRPDALVVSICFRYQVNSSVVHSVSTSGWWEVAGENVEMFMIERASTLELKKLVCNVYNQMLPLKTYLCAVSCLMKSVGLSLLNLMHAQRGLTHLVCGSVCLSVNWSPNISEFSNISKLSPFIR